jgi:hypothetical protein
MASPYYVRSGAAGTGDGSSWTNAYTTLTLALASGKVAGDVFYISEDHAESSATALTFTSPGTSVSPCKFICVNHSGSVPPVSADLRTTGSIATTGNAGIAINSSATGGASIFYGLVIAAGNSSGSPVINMPSTPNSCSYKYINCTIKIVSTGAGTISIGNSGAAAGDYVEFENTTVSFAGTGQGFVISGTFRWRNTLTALAGTIPTALFQFTAGRGGSIDISDVDLSGAGSGKTLISSTAGAASVWVRLMDCKLNASVTMVSASAAIGSVSTDLIRCGSTGVNYKVHRDRYTGTLDDETTITRSGGATDGTTPISWKIVTMANASFNLPFEAIPTAIWNDSTSNVTATIYGTINSGTLPNNDEIFIDVEYLGSSSTPQGSIATSAKADLIAVAAAVSSDASSWNGGGSGAGWSPFKLTATFTPAQKGPINIIVKAGKASTTYYVDPMVVLS